MRCGADTSRSARVVVLSALGLLALAIAMPLVGVGCGGGGAATGGTATVTGTVVDATDPSQPVGNAYVYVPLGARSVGSSARQTAEQGTYTDSNGYFLLTGVAVGERYLRVRPPSGTGATEEHEYALDLTEGATVTIRPTIVPDALLNAVASVNVTTEAGDNTFALAPGAQRQLVAAVLDTNGQPMQLTPTWSLTGAPGLVSVTGLFTAGATEGVTRIVATVGTVSGSATATIEQPGASSYEIAFYSDRDTGDGTRDKEIFLMNEDGSNVRQLTDNSYEDRAPCFSRDGQRIAFASDPDSDGKHDIYVMDRDGSNVQPLIVNAGSDDKYPVFSPVSGDLAFLSDRDGDSDIWLLRAGQSVPQNITDEGVGVPGDDLIFDWSPDGTRIAFRSDRHNPGASNYEVFTIVLATGDEANLTQDVADDGAPSFDPSGAMLVFSSNRAGDSLFHLFRYRFADGAITQFTSDDDRSDGDPDWSPDGGRIAFVGWMGNEADIYVTRADGTGAPVQLTNTRLFSSFALASASAYWFFIHWMPAPAVFTASTPGGGT